MSNLLKRRLFRWIYNPLPRLLAVRCVHAGAASETCVSDADRLLKKDIMTVSTRDHHLNKQSRSRRRFVCAVAGCGLIAMASIAAFAGTPSSPPPAGTKSQPRQHPGFEPIDAGLHVEADKKVSLVAPSHGRFAFGQTCSLDTPRIERALKRFRKRVASDRLNFYLKISTAFSEVSHQQP